jgi:hypothetical protein
VLLRCDLRELCCHLLHLLAHPRELFLPVVCSSSGTRLLQQLLELAVPALQFVGLSLEALLLMLQALSSAFGSLFFQRNLLGLGSRAFGTQLLERSRFGSLACSTLLLQCFLLGRVRTGRWVLLPSGRFPPLFAFAPRAAVLLLCFRRRFGDWGCSARSGTPSELMHKLFWVNHRWHGGFPLRGWVPSSTWRQNFFVGLGTHGLLTQSGRVRLLTLS